MSKYTHKDALMAPSKEEFLAAHEIMLLSHSNLGFSPKDLTTFNSFFGVYRDWYYDNIDIANKWKMEINY